MTEIYRLNLAMFDGEGESGMATADTTNRAEPGREVSVSQVLGETGAKSEPVVEETQKVEEPQLSREEQFAKMIGKGGEFRDLYNARMQKAVSDRMAKATREAEAVQPVLDLLHQRFGTNDPVKLAEELNRDDAFWQNAADEAGMDVADYRNMQQLKASEARMQEQIRMMTQQRATEAKLAEWQAEAAALQSKYPDIDLEAESANPAFARMLAAGASVENAYQMVHHDELVQKAIDYAMGAAQKSVADTVRANGMRPVETAVGGATAPVSMDLSNMPANKMNELFSYIKNNPGAKIKLK